MREVVPGIGQQKRRVIVTRGAFGGRDASRRLRRLYFGVASGKPYDILAKMIQPEAQRTRVIPIRIRRHKNDLEAGCYFLWQLLERAAQIGHVHRADIGTIRVTEK